MGNLLNLERERLRQASLKGGRDSKTWKPEDGDKNVIRVLTFKHKVTKEDVEAKLYDKEEIGKTIGEWSYPYQVHLGLHPKHVFIPVSSTPEIMGLYLKLKKSKDLGDQKRAEEIRPQKKYAMNVVDINAPEKGVQTYLAPKSVREAVGDHVVSPHYGEEVLGIKGRDWQITYDSKSKDRKSFYKVIILPEKACRAMRSKVENMVQDLFNPEVNRDFAEVKDLDELDAAGGKNEGQPPTEDLEGTPEKTNGNKGGIFDAED